MGAGGYGDDNSVGGGARFVRAVWVWFEGLMELELTRPRQEHLAGSKHFISGRGDPGAERGARASAAPPDCWVRKWFRWVDMDVGVKMGFLLLMGVVGVGRDMWPVQDMMRVLPSMTMDG